MKLGLVGVTVPEIGELASENVMFATADHNASPDSKAAFSAAVQFEAASNQ